MNRPCEDCGMTYPSPHAVAEYDSAWLCPECAIDRGYCFSCGKYAPEEIQYGDLPGMCEECQASAWASIDEEQP